MTVKVEPIAPFVSVTSEDASDSPQGVSCVTVNQMGSEPVGDGVTVTEEGGGKKDGGSAACSRKLIKTSPTNDHWLNSHLPDTIGMSGVATPDES